MQPWKESIPSGMAHAERYIIRGYNPSTYGDTFIKDEDIVRPFNHRYTQAVDYANNWLVRSMAKRQTYGTCFKCFDAGPNYQQCRKCGYEESYLTFCFGFLELDSMMLAHCLERDLFFQRADRKFENFTPRKHQVDVKTLQMAVGQDRELTERRREVIFNQVMDMLPFDERSRNW